MAESGYPDATFVSWTAVFGPPKMPSDVVAKISRAISKAVKTPEVAQRLRNIGFDPVGLDAGQLDTFQRDVAASWKKIAQETGIKLRR
jgi:tripartite-type tricarboxylate transporter receptor subunit TctC